MSKAGAGTGLGPPGVEVRSAQVCLFSLESTARLP